MQNLKRIFATTAAIALMIVVAGVCWFYLYSGDIPSISDVRGFAPDIPTSATDACRQTSRTVIPYSELGNPVVSATRAAEGNEQTISLQLSRGMFCSGSKLMKRQFLEYKASVQLRTRMSAEQLLTAYLNRADFGEGLMGIYEASQKYFGKAPRDLDVAQAAMLVGLLKAPTRYSPIKHPDRAKQRRDEVIRSMVDMHLVSADAGQLAISSDLRMVQ